jgi:hypothetical protein
MSSNNTETKQERLNKACIVVKTLARTNFEINDITENTKIEDIKLLLFNKYNIDMSQIRLIYSGKCLNNEQTVEEAGIYDTTKTITISMILSLRG